MKHVSKVTETTTTFGTDGADGAGNRLGNCDTDSFSVTNPGGKSPPAICGVNTGNKAEQASKPCFNCCSGQHMYLPASPQCNTLATHIGATSTATTSSFSIKVGHCLKEMNVLNVLP